MSLRSRRHKEEAPFYAIRSGGRKKKAVEQHDAADASSSNNRVEDEEGPEIVTDDSVRRQAEQREALEQQAQQRYEAKKREQQERQRDRQQRMAQQKQEKQDRQAARAKRQRQQEEQEELEEQQQQQQFMNDQPLDEQLSQQLSTADVLPEGLLRVLGSNAPLTPSPQPKRKVDSAHKQRVQRERKLHKKLSDVWRDSGVRVEMLKAKPAVSIALPADMQKFVKESQNAVKRSPLVLKHRKTKGRKAHSKADDDEMSDSE